MPSKSRRKRWGRVIGRMLLFITVAFVLYVGACYYVDELKYKHNKARAERTARVAGTAYQGALRDALAQGPVDLGLFRVSGVRASASYGDRSAVHVLFRSAQPYYSGTLIGLTDVELCFDNVVDLTEKPPSVTMSEIPCTNLHHERLVPVLRPTE
jgi:hypothetical protein